MPHIPCGTVDINQGPRSGGGMQSGWWSKNSLDYARRMRKLSLDLDGFGSSGRRQHKHTPHKFPFLGACISNARKDIHGSKIHKIEDEHLWKKMWVSGKTSFLLVSFAQMGFLPVHSPPWAIASPWATVAISRRVLFPAPIETNRGGWILSMLTKIRWYHNFTAISVRTLLYHLIKLWCGFRTN